MVAAKILMDFCKSSEILELHKLISDGTRINDNKYLESLVTTTELIACVEEQIQKMLIYFDIQIYLHFKSISYPVNFRYFI